ncbi:hypothetical protein Bca52824_008619 [Brassica carinata]|uniref:RRM domain-containing protein n=1 Tax=Brassica carinata TaxID=52824 RepID=A0A8X7W9K0_BRACI|nr:hypothetical protein Bca52824_008619 [Brassica carinata]
MDSDQGKLFVGGISWETDEDKLREHFSSYGDVSQTIGFGFVIFSDPSLLDRVLQDKHHIDSREVDVKRAMSREEQQVSGRSGNFNASRSSGGDAYNKTKRPAPFTRRPMSLLCGAGRAMGGGGGGYQGFGGGNESSFDGVDFNRYMQPQNVGNGLPSYGSSGYGVGGGYGNGSNGAGLGGYGAYGGGAAYGATSMPGAGYGSSVAPRNSWDTPSAPSGYGNPGGYGNGAAQTTVGYGGSGGNGDSGYGNQAAYGAVGGRPGVGGLNNPGGYMGGYDPSQGGYGLGRQGQ